MKWQLLGVIKVHKNFLIKKDFLHVNKKFIMEFGDDSQIPSCHNLNNDNFRGEISF